MDDLFQKFAEEYAAYGYPVLFAGVLLENAGLPVPGETAVLVAGFLASPAGGGHFHLALVIVLTVIAAILGDNLGFWLGHRFARPRMLQGKRFLFLTPKSLELAEGYFHRYGLWTIFFARFITGLRVVAALAAGTAGMPWGRFLAANAAGAVAWATTMSLLGYFFGHSWELLHRWLGRGGLIALACVVVLFGLPYLLRRLRNMEFVRGDRLTRAQLIQGGLVAVVEVMVIALLFVLAHGHHATGLDDNIREWLKENPTPILHGIALAGNVAGSLPLLVVWTAMLWFWLWRRQRDWREHAVAVGALAVTEALGLFLVLAFHLGEIEQMRAVTWPKGFAGLVPMRAFAVFGITAYFIQRQKPALGRFAMAVAGLLVVMACFGVVWLRAQTLTEMLLECVVGGLVLFTGIWWLEGHGSEIVQLPAVAPPQPMP